MARGKKSGPSRMDLRKQAEAAEAKEREEGDEDVEETEDEDDEEEGDEDVDAEVDAEADAEAGDADDTGDDDDDDEAPKKKKKAVKKKAAPKAKKPATKRVRTPKEVRQKAVWIVFDNSSKEVGTFDYSKKHDAEKFLEKKIQEKEGKATFYLNLVKRELKDEKEKEK